MSKVGWWARWTLGLLAQSLDRLLLILRMVSGWKSFLGRRVDIITLLLGKVVEALSMTLLRDSDTLSCWRRRSLVPVWMMMCLGDSSCSSDNSSIALWVFGHQIFDTLLLGKSFFSSRNFPLESIRMTMSGFSLCCAGLVLVCAVGGDVVLVCGLEVEMGVGVACGTGGSWLFTESWMCSGLSSSACVSAPLSCDEEVSALLCSSELLYLL